MEIARIEPILKLHCLWIFTPNTRPWQEFYYRGERFMFVHLTTNPFINDYDERKNVLLN